MTRAPEEQALLDLQQLVERDAPFERWRGERIPWQEPPFSERMLAEHLSQRHDLASRRLPVIEAQVRWLHERVLGGRRSRVLDLACGPGLYLAALAELGHRCRGIDFAPAAVRYAQSEAARRGLDCEFLEADVRSADYGTGYDLVMMISGELQGFLRSDAATILGKARSALAPIGQLLLEVHPHAVLERLGSRSPFWYRSSGGLFSERPHLVLRECAWDERHGVATTDYFVIDAVSASVSRYRDGLQAYTEDQLHSLLAEAGLEARERFDSLSSLEPKRDPFEVWVAAASS